MCDSLTNGERRLWSLLEPQVKILIDVGIGKELTFPDNKTTQQYCFECNPLFCKQLERFKSPTVGIITIGLSDCEGEKIYYSHSETFHCRPSLNGCSSDCKCKRVVSITRLDTWIQENKLHHIDFLKIDVEGHELAVLKGAKNSLYLTRWVQFEYGGTYKDAKIKLNDVYKLLKLAGFMYIYLILPTTLELTSKANEDYQYANYFATREKLN